MSMFCTNCGYSTDQYKGDMSDWEARDKEYHQLLTLLSTGTLQIEESRRVYLYRRNYGELCDPVDVGGKTEHLPSEARFFAECRFPDAQYLQVVSIDHRVKPYISSIEWFNGDDHIYRTTFALAPNTPIIELLPTLLSYCKKSGKDTYTCPFCGTTLKDKNAHYESYLDLPSEYERCKKEKETILAEIKQDIPITAGSEPNHEIDLRAFLKHLLHLEANLYSLEKVLTNTIEKRRELYSKERMVAVGLPMIQNAKRKYMRDELAQKISEAETALHAIPDQLPFISENVTSVTIAIPMPRMPELQKPWFFNKAKVEAENAALLNAYEEGKAKYDSAYQKALLEEQERRKAQNKQIAGKREEKAAKLRDLIDSLNKQLDENSSSMLVNPYTELHNLSKAEIQDIKDKMRELYIARAKLIAMGVIHPKYVDVVALSTILEYLETGRCTQLEGHEGAYNLYESESRANRIIAQLDQVIYSLDRIKGMQYYTYKVMTEIQSNTQAISTKMDTAISALDKISEDTDAIRETSAASAYNTAVIAYNTEKTAYYAKINAELTDALGYMVALT